MHSCQNPPEGFKKCQTCCKGTPPICTNDTIFCPPASCKNTTDPLCAINEGIAVSHRKLYVLIIFFFFFLIGP